MNPEKTEGPNRTRFWRNWYTGVRHFFGAILVITCGMRATGRKNIPNAGPTLMMANHASFYDTFVLGVAQRRMIDFMARSGLFLPLIGPFIRSMGGFPIQRDGGGAAGVKETLKRLKIGRLIGLFPEGTRTPNGQLQPLRPGIANIARKSGSQILCVGIHGAFEAWPRSQLLPAAYQMHVHYEPPILPDELTGKSEEEVMQMLRERLERAMTEACAAVDRLRDYRLY